MTISSYLIGILWGLNYVTYVKNKHTWLLAKCITHNKMYNKWQLLSSSANSYMKIQLCKLQCGVLRDPGWEGRYIDVSENKIYYIKRDLDNLEKPIAQTRAGLAVYWLYNLRESMELLQFSAYSTLRDCLNSGCLLEFDRNHWDMSCRALSRVPIRIHSLKWFCFCLLSSLMGKRMSICMSSFRFSSWYQ